MPELEEFLKSLINLKGTVCTVLIKIVSVAHISQILFYLKQELFMCYTLNSRLYISSHDTSI